MSDQAPVQYGEYLKLDELLSLQQPLSGTTGPPAHDEMLFIITHQAYELWFRQILYELDSVIEIFAATSVDDRKLGQAIARLQRIHAIQNVLVQQINIIETMTPLDFLEFRDNLVPASGFQSLQFKELEIRLGLRFDQRSATDRDFFRTRLSDSDRARLTALEQKDGLLQVIVEWLERMPFLSFGQYDFWREYTQAVDKMFARDRGIIEGNQSLSDDERDFQLKHLRQTRERFDAVLDDEEFTKQQAFGLPHRAVQAALFINLYRDEPMMQLPFRLLTGCVEIDELLTIWRSRHALMVERMLGRKIGTGGSSGYDYLRTTTERNRVFGDLFNLSTFLIRRSDLPVLPKGLTRSLGFYFTGRPDDG